METSQILKKLNSQRNLKNVAGMKRFGISSKNTLGISIYVLRGYAKKIGKSHKTALLLWDSGIHEARILASYIDEPEKVTEKQIEKWVKDFDSWDICDQVCSNLFDQTKFAFKKAHKWPGRKEEFVKRAGFVLMAALSVHNNSVKNEDFIKFFPLIIKHSTDERNFVRKAVNWALRQIGKRNLALNRMSITAAKKIQKIGSKSASWIAKDAIRELQSEKVRKRLKANSRKSSWKLSEKKS